MQRVHFQVRVGVNKSWQRFFSFVIFDIVIKKTNRMWFSVALVKFHWFGINWHVFNQSECGNCCLYNYYHSENCSTSQIWKILPNMVFPRFGGKKWRSFWACVCKLSWTLLSPARVQPLYGAGRKESSGTGLAFLSCAHDIASSWNRWKYGGAKWRLHCLDENCLGEN